MTNPDLKKFCNEMLLALDGKVIPHWFHSGFALCTNAGRYDQRHETMVYSTLAEMFDGDSYPFNDGNERDYRHERWNGLFYQNEKRMAFLKKYAEGA